MGGSSDGRAPLGVVMLSKALVVGSYQRKAESIAAQPDLRLTVAVPPLWRDGRQVRRLERAHTVGYDLVSTPIVGAGRFHLHFYPRFGQVLAKARPVVVHIDEEPYNLATWLAFASALRQGARPLFFSWQNLLRRYPPPFGLMERDVFRKAAGAIAGSASAASVLRSKGYAGPLWVIPQFGVDVDHFRPASTPAVRDTPVVGFAGRLVAAKGVDLLVAALASIDGPWQLEIVGEGPAATDLERLAAARGVAPRVRIRPWLPGDRMPAFYNSIDLFVLPSRSTPSWVEQFGRVLIEAMACGVACIGSDSGEIPSVLADAGVTFREGDEAELRAAIVSLLESPARRADLADAGRRRAAARFSMDRVAADTADVYRSVADPAARRTGEPS